jgi:glycosyltransferase involved in cell wall biosynthesis
MHVLVVSNHWSRYQAPGPNDEPQKGPTHGSIWVDRQIEALRSLGVRVSTFDIGASHSPFKLWRKLWELRREVKRINPDVVHARYGTLVGTLSVFSGCATVVSYQGSDLLQGEGGISWLRIFVGHLLSNLASLRAQAIICVSERLRQALWWRKRAAVVIPDGVDLNFFAPCSRDEARQKIGWDTNRVVVLIDAVLDPIRKGLDLAQRAVQIVQRCIPKAELVVLQVQPHEVPLYLNAADVLLCASRAEGSPNIVKEALACNLPIVATPVGDVPERLQGVVPSKVVAREPEAMAQALIEILSLNQRSNGRERVMQIAQEAARKNLEIYRRVSREPHSGQTAGRSLAPAGARLDAHPPSV